VLREIPERIKANSASRIRTNPRGVSTNLAARRASPKEPNKMRVGIHVPNPKGNILFKEAPVKSGQQEKKDSSLYTLQ